MGQRDVRLPQDARFTCQSCGRCCTMWSVTVSAKKVETLRKHDWGSDPFQTHPGPGDPYRIRMVSGRCFFLDDDMRCRIHRELSYDAKPDGCKAFPLHLTEVGGNTYGRLSFYCPSASKNDGKLLRDQQRWVRETVRAVGTHPRHDPITLDGVVAIGPRELSALEALLLQQIQTDDAPLNQRLAATAGILVQCRDATVGASKDKSPWTDTLDRLQRTPRTTLADEGLADGARAKGTTVLSLFLGQDAPPRKRSRLIHFFGVRLFNLRLAALHSYLLMARASQRQIRAVAFDPPPDAVALLTRYVADKIRSRRYLGDNFSVIQGMNLLFVAYGIVHLLARLGAAKAGRTACNTEDIRAAVQAADLLVVEHTTLLHSPLFASLVRGILSNPRLFASIAATEGTQT